VLPIGRVDWLALSDDHCADVLLVVSHVVVLILPNRRGVIYIHLVLAICSVSCWVGCKRIV